MTYTPQSGMNAAIQGAGYLTPGSQSAMTRSFASRARTFGFATRFLPPDRRDAVTGLYAFCRVMDDLSDDVPPEQGVPALAAWHTWLEQIDLGGRPPPPPLPDGIGSVDACALAGGIVRLVEERGLPPRYLRQLVEGASLDALRSGIRDFTELRAFCFSVAGTVGLAMCHVLGAPTKAALRHAELLGIAMQLTNVLRDVGEDAGRGRVYLPADEMDRFHVTRDQVERGQVDARFAALMRFQISRARRYYASGMPGVFLLPPECRLAILVAGRLYAAILGCIERQRFDVFSRRASTSTLQKVWLTSGALFVLSGTAAPTSQRSLQQVAPR